LISALIDIAQTCDLAKLYWIKADRPLTCDTLNVPWLQTNRLDKCIITCVKFLQNFVYWKLLKLVHF